MPRIRLKEKSPEFEDIAKAAPKQRICDHPGCDEEGVCRAPKDRKLSGYYHFCQTHAQDYNKRWNFFEGMSESEIQDYIYKSATWDRPTWKFSTQADMEDYLREKVKDDFFSDEAAAQRRQENQQRYQERMREKIFRESGTEEGEAMAILELTPPVTLDALKKRYKALVKKHHPDVNDGSKEAEEKFKKINMAYTVLKVAYESFEKLEEESFTG